MTPTVDDYIAAAMSAFRAQRGERMIHAGGRPMRVRTGGERILHLPNGQHVKVSVDDSGVATQVEEDEKLHAIVRPQPIRRRITVAEAAPVIAALGRPRPVKVRTTQPFGGTSVPRR